MVSRPQSPIQQHLVDNVSIRRAEGALTDGRGPVARTRTVKSPYFTLGTLVLLVVLTFRVRAAEVAKPDANGYIRNWLMLAPIPLSEGRQAGDLLLEEQIKGESNLRPKAGDTINVNKWELTWKPVTASTNFFDFNATLKSLNDRAAGYLVTYIECDREMVGMTMSVGSNDQGRIYLNGVDIYAFTEARPLELDADKGHVRLKEGINVVVFKIINEQNAWQGAMRLLDKTGKPLTDFKIKLSP